MSAAKFPTTSTQLDTIAQFATDTLRNPNTLAIEIKSSWVDTTNLKNKDQYIMIDAIIPAYKKVNDSHWIISGTKTTRLALVGMHVVGSINNHPEMVWATFEHKYNSPNSSYNYLNDKRKIVNVPADTGYNWLFCSNAQSRDTNIAYMKALSHSIKAINGHKIMPSNTRRTKPFGSGLGSVSNPQDATDAAANSELISFNNAIRRHLKNDIRLNYILMGATWTNGGVAPNGQSYTNTLDSVSKINAAIGTSQLANSTMETYSQNGALYANYGSCFGCHFNYTHLNLDPNYLSHVYTALQPLPPATKKK